MPRGRDYPTRVWYASLTLRSQRCIDSNLLRRHASFLRLLRERYRTLHSSNEQGYLHVLTLSFAGLPFRYVICLLLTSSNFAANLLQVAVFIDEADSKKMWSEANVSEDFHMALRLQLRGYIIRWASYSNGGFKEGVSLTVDDELN